MTKQMEEQRNDFLLDVRAAVKRNQVVVMILFNSEEDEYMTMSNGYDIEFDDVLKAFCEMPFLGRISPLAAFEGWDEYFDDAALGIAYYLKRVNAHAERRELSTSVLGNFRLIPQLSENKNQKWTFSLMSYYLLSVHRIINFVIIPYLIYYATTPSS